MTKKIMRQLKAKEGERIKKNKAAAVDGVGD